MAAVTFYLQADDEIDGQPAGLSLACQIAARCFRQKQWALVLCESKSQAEALDELMWARPTDGFIPHNLSGEGPANGAPIEICWQMPTRISRGTLINLSGSLPEQLQRFKQIYDFVPVQEEQKQQARDRYKHYRSAGCQLATEPATSLHETNDG